MIVQVRPRGICQSCRYDLQQLFERGFCTTSKPLRTRSLRVRRHPYSHVRTQRPFHSSRFLASSRQDDTSHIAHDSQPDASDGIDRLTAQVALLEKLEKELGKPLEQAIQEDEVSAETLIQYREALDSIATPLQDENSSVRRVASLREAGASLSEIVRSARQSHGDVLPDGLLNEQETTLYKRFYGEPAKEMADEDNESEGQTQEDITGKNQLFAAGGEEIDYRPYTEEVAGSNLDGTASPRMKNGLERAQAGQLDLSLNDRLIEEDDYDEYEGDEFDGDEEGMSDSGRAHPLTMVGKFRTNPSTVFLSQDGFVKPVERKMSDYSNKHLKEVCERVFGGPGLPDSPLTPKSARGRKQVPVGLDVNQNTMSEMESNAFVTVVMPPTYASVMSVLVETRKRLGTSWLNSLLAREGGPRVLDAGAGGAGILAWKDLIQAHWDSLHTPESTTLSPPASKFVVVTGSDGLRHRAAEMLENTTFVPRLPDYIHTRTTPTLDDDRPSQQRKKFDVIIAPHTLFGLSEDWMRKQYVQNLWTMLSDEGGVLVLVEKGVPRGFEAIACAREMLLDRFIAVPEGDKTHYSSSQNRELEDNSIHKKETAMIVAPCTTHERCPMYTAPGLARGRKDICSFQQRYIRPPFLQRILGAKDRNHDDVEFSYLSVLKGDDLRSRDITDWESFVDPFGAPYHPKPAELSKGRQKVVQDAKFGFEDIIPSTEENMVKLGSPSAMDNQHPTFQQMPRIVYPPIKRRGHVTIDLCTPEGAIERWTVPKSFSRQAYRDARKARWGDLWALGAKTHIPRNLKLGATERDLLGKDGEVIPGKGRNKKERQKIKAMQMMEMREEEKMNDLIEQQDMIQALDEELDADYSMPSNLGVKEATSSTTKRPNNRERKAARKALREVKAQKTSDASGDTVEFDDSAFESMSPSDSPRELPKQTADHRDSVPRSKPQAQRLPNMQDELEMENNLSDWQSELAALATVGKQKDRRSVFNKDNKAAQGIFRRRGQI